MSVINCFIAKQELNSVILLQTLAFVKTAKFIFVESLFYIFITSHPSKYDIALILTRTILSDIN